MGSPIIEGYLFAWKKNQDYGAKLVSDLSEDQMVAQPAANPEAPSNHPAWVLSHLNVYHPVICSIIKGESFEDPKNHQFGMLSKPEASRDIYAAKQDLVDSYVNGHEEIAKLLSHSDDSIFSLPTKLERWKNIMPTAGTALPYLMFNHENGHLGQISAWRRIQGLPSV
ncbi:MAG: DinB family protein [Mariniblastus sp.]|nr:DinB family protein [Mariniblastus sp.]